MIYQLLNRRANRQDCCSIRLTAEIGRGFSRSNLKNVRRFFLKYHKTAGQISQTPSGILSGDTVETHIISQVQKEQEQGRSILSWLHCVFLLTIETGMKDSL
jgi:hypothetical protein